MSRESQKARKRANRCIKRQGAHLQNIIEKYVEPEQLSRRDMCGKLDLTAYYAIFNTMNPDRKRYGF